MKELKVAVICNNEEELMDVRKSIYPDWGGTWRNCSHHKNDRITLSRDGWAGEKWFKNNPSYQVMEYKDWKRSIDPQYDAVINNYQIF